MHPTTPSTASRPPVHPAGGNGRKPRHHKTTVADAVRRYRRMSALSHVIDADTSSTHFDDRDGDRRDYTRRARTLLTDMITGLTHLPEHDRRTALTALATPDPAEIARRQTEPLEGVWRAYHDTRRDLDHDLADLAAIPLLLAQHAQLTLFLNNSDLEIIELRDEITTRDHRIQQLEATLLNHAIPLPPAVAAADLATDNLARADTAIAPAHTTPGQEDR
ncbi:hypothetical protein [Nocardia asiatica]|uniref:hypothetical protein n=1 Tax=Nocardia asiatica TaxID=209252 RepID=UPI0002FE31C4|nr:hypothetical protein [Nocardia asiatica]